MNALQAPTACAGPGRRHGALKGSAGSAATLCAMLLAAAGVPAAPSVAAPLAAATAATAAATAADPQPPADSQSGAALERLMALLARQRHAAADFQERQYLAVLTQPLVSSGQLIYDAPDHLEQRTVQPRKQTMVLDHGMLIMQIGKRRRTVRLADYPQLAPLIDSMRATLAGDRATLERLFTLQFSGTLEHWQLRLEPHAGPLAVTLKAIDLQGEGAAISEVQVLQSDGDRSVMHIQPHE